MSGALPGWVPGVALDRMWKEIGVDVVAAVERVGVSGQFVLGQEVKSFENGLSSLIGNAFAVACANGTDAIELALRALGLREGQRVATTAFSAFATTTGIVRAGGVPVFFDTDDNGNIDLGLLEAGVEQSRVDFAVPVHLYGNPLDLDRLEALSRMGVQVIEDCAQAHLAEFRGRIAGSVGLAATHSFYPTKTIPALGDAGSVSTNSAGTAKKLREIRDYGQTSKYVHERYGFNSRMDEIHAAILTDAILPRIADWVQRRMYIAEWYMSEIDSSRLRWLTPDVSAAPSWHLFPVFVKTGTRESFESWMRSEAVEIGSHYPRLIPDQAAMRSVRHHVVGDLRVARSLAESEVSLPMNPFLTDDEIAKVVQACNRWPSAD